MATYGYRCACGDFDITRPIGTAEASAACPECGRPARRLFSPPMTRQVSAPLAGALARAERSADAPEVVTKLPPKPRRAPSRPQNPMWAKLPRP